MFQAGLENSKIFAVTLYIRGKPWTVTVDNIVPTYVNSNRIKPYYFDIFRDHYWTSILYKSMAKAYGSYNNFYN